MAHLSKLFTKQPVDIPNRSGHDLSFENLLTVTPGTLVPVLCEEVIPNETYNLGHVSQVKLPPMATDFFGRIDLRFEAFFVPMRILWGGWQNFWTMPENNPYGSPVLRPTRVPSATGVTITRGSLADYLGVKCVTSTPGNLEIPNVLPFIAYHRIYDEWYRNSKIQKPAFTNSVSTEASDTVPLAYQLPWIGSYVNIRFAYDSDVRLADGVSIFSLRQRNWAKDYFTTASLYPQASGDVVGSSVEPSSDGSISIPALRAANVLQRWLDRNNIAGERYSDQIKAQYGVTPSDAILDRPVFLGSDAVGIYNKTIFATNDSSNGIKNPYSGIGLRGADSSGFKDGSLIDSFKVTEHGYIMVLY